MAVNDLTQVIPLTTNEKGEFSTLYLAGNAGLHEMVCFFKAFMLMYVNLR